MHRFSVLSVVFWMGSAAAACADSSTTDDPTLMQSAGGSMPSGNAGQPASPDMPSAGTAPGPAAQVPTPAATDSGAVAGGGAGAGGAVGPGGAGPSAGGAVGLGGAEPSTGGTAAGGTVGLGGAEPSTGGTAAGGTVGLGGAEPSTGGTAAGGAGGGAGASTVDLETLEPFSFFVTSLEAMRRLSGSQDGFGGDLRYGEADGLSGADKICTEIAESSMEGAGAKQWRAFLSVKSGPDGQPVNAIDRVGQGPWYDRLGRLIAEDVSGLLQERPTMDPEIVDNLPNELGENNQFAGGVEMNNHDVLTASNEQGELDGPTCGDWTALVSEEDEGPNCGHSYPAFSGTHWIFSHTVAGCAPSVVEGQGSFGGDGVGDGGGYGAIYCFALNP